MKMDPNAPNSYLMIDSTPENHKWIKMVDHNRSHNRRNSNWTLTSAMNDLSAAQYNVCPGRPWCNMTHPDFTSETLGPDNVTEVHYLGTMEGRRLHDFESFRQHIFEGLNEIQPDVLVVNMGLHFLHFIWKEIGWDPAFPHADWISSVVNYETEWLDQVMQHLPDSVQIVLFKTTNRICHDRYTSLLSQLSKLYDRTSPEYPTLVHECRKQIRSYWDIVTSASTLNTKTTYGTEQWNISYWDTVRSIPNKNTSTPTVVPFTGPWTFGNNNTVLTDQQIDEYCAYGTFDDVGPIHLNRKLKKWVDRYNKLQKSTNATGPVVQIYNDHSIQQCPYTEMGDGRHFPALNLARARLLLNQMQCIQSAYNL